MAEGLRAASATLPIRTMVTPIAVDGSLSLARSTLRMRTGGSGESFDFSGASVHADPEHATRVSRFEVMERVFAMPALHRGVERFVAYDYFDDTAAGWLAAEEVLLTTKAPVGARGSERPEGRGAVGLGLGPSLEFAKAHALREVLERHIRTRLWYGEGERPLAVGVPRPVGDRFELRRYAASFTPAPPFCLSIVTARDGEAVFFAGSALAESFDLAAGRADAEALMLLDTYVAGRTGWANTPEGRERFLGLRGAALSRRIEHFARRVTPGHAEAPAVTMDDATIHRLVTGAGAGDARYAVVARVDGMTLVRVVCAATTWERRERARLDANVPEDPFC